MIVEGQLLGPYIEKNELAAAIRATARGPAAVALSYQVDIPAPVKELLPITGMISQGTT